MYLMVIKLYDRKWRLHEEHYFNIDINGMARPSKNFSRKILKKISLWISTDKAKISLDPRKKSLPDLPPEKKGKCSKCPIKDTLVEKTKFYLFWFLNFLGIVFSTFSRFHSRYIQYAFWIPNWAINYLFLFVERSCLRTFVIILFCLSFRVDTYQEMCHALERKTSWVVDTWSSPLIVYDGPKTIPR